MMEHSTTPDNFTDPGAPLHQPAPVGARSAGAGISRRRLAVATAWAVPTVALAVSTPAIAASPLPPNALQGWVELQWSCTASGNTEFEIDGRGSYDQRGIWVTTTLGPPVLPPSNAKITFFFERSDLFFNNASESGWSNLVRSAVDDELTGIGFFAYTTFYAGVWNYVDAGGTDDDRWEAASDPAFTLPAPFYAGSCRPISAYARRTVDFNGTAGITFRRGPVTLGN